MIDFSIYDAVAVPVFVVGSDGEGPPTYRYCNTACLELVGRTADMMIGRPAIEVFGARLGSAVTDRHSSVIASGKASSYNITLPVSQGEVIVKSNLTPLAGHPGLIVGTNLPVGRRIDQARDLARSARDAQRDTELTARALSLRGPMRKHGFLVEELKRDFTDLGNGKLELIDEIADLGERAYDLVRLVLTYTRAVSAVAPEAARLERIALPEFCESLFAAVDPTGALDLAARNRQVLLERSVLWFVLHAVLSHCAGASAPQQIEIDCEQAKGGMVDVILRNRTSKPPEMNGESCNKAEVETVLKSRGGSLRMEQEEGVQRCIFSLPGRVFAEG